MRGRADVSDERLQRLAKRMRHEPVLYERRLWAVLRDRRLSGLKFRRQMVIGPYIADFVCLRHRLIVEADGPHHDPERDAVRDAWLTSQNFRVLRFTNQEIENREWEVIGTILDAARANTDPRPPL